MPVADARRNRRKTAFKLTFATTERILCRSLDHASRADGGASWPNLLNRHKVLHSRVRCPAVLFLLPPFSSQKSCAVVHRASPNSRRRTAHSQRLSLR